MLQPGQINDVVTRYPAAIAEVRGFLSGAGIPVGKVDSLGAVSTRLVEDRGFHRDLTSHLWVLMDRAGTQASTADFLGILAIAAAGTRLAAEADEHSAHLLLRFIMEARHSLDDLPPLHRAGTLHTTKPAPHAGALAEAPIVPGRRSFVEDVHPVAPAAPVESSSLAASVSEVEARGIELQPTTARRAFFVVPPEGTAPGTTAISSAAAPQSRKGRLYALAALALLTLGLAGFWLHRANVSEKAKDNAASAPIRATPQVSAPSLAPADVAATSGSIAEPSRTVPPMVRSSAAGIAPRDLRRPGSPAADGRSTATAQGAAPLDVRTATAGPVPANTAARGPVTSAPSSADHTSISQPGVAPQATLTQQSPVASATAPIQRSAATRSVPPSAAGLLTIRPASAPPPAPKSAVSATSLTRQLDSPHPPAGYVPYAGGNAKYPHLLRRPAPSALSEDGGTLLSAAGSAPALPPGRSVGGTTPARTGVVRPAVLGTMAANLIYSPTPAYPAAASAANVQGEVRVIAEVDRDGNVASARVISGPPLLRDAALDAVQHWRYKPYFAAGRPVAMSATAVVSFELQ